MSLKFIPIGPIDNKSALVQVGDYEASRRYTGNNVDGELWRYLASLGLNELTQPPLVPHIASDSNSEVFISL